MKVNRSLIALVLLGLFCMPVFASVVSEGNAYLYVETSSDFSPAGGLTITGVITPNDDGVIIEHTLFTTSPNMYIALLRTIDLSPYLGETVTMYWSQGEGGTLGITDALYFQISGDGGLTWSDLYQAFKDDIGPYPVADNMEIPEIYKGSKFTMKWWITGFTSPKYCDFGDISIRTTTETIWSDTTDDFTYWCPSPAWYPTSSRFRARNSSTALYKTQSWKLGIENNAGDLNLYGRISTTGDSDANYKATGATDLTIGQTYHIALVWNPSTTIEVFVNGVSDGVAVSSPATLYTNIPHPIILLSGQDCTLHDITFYDLVLTDNQILENYLANIKYNSYLFGLIGKMYLPFDNLATDTNCDGQTFLDRSGNNHNAVGDAGWSGIGLEAIGETWMNYLE